MANEPKKPQETTKKPETATEKKLTPEEIKAEKVARFKKVAGHRATNAVRALKLLENCSSPTNYSYTKEQTAKLFSAIDEAVSRVKKAFENKSEDNDIAIDLS